MRKVIYYDTVRNHGQYEPDNFKKIMDESEGVKLVGLTTNNGKMGFRYIIEPSNVILQYEHSRQETSEISTVLVTLHGEQSELEKFLRKFK